MIICAGEALIDMLPRQTPAGETAFAPYPGGAVFNTAIALGRLGARAAFFSGISRDLFGEMLASALAASKVQSLAHRSDRPTTLAFVTLTGGQAKYAFYDENTAGRMLGKADLPGLPRDAAALFFGGISLVAEPCGSTYEALMTREAPQRVTMIDPNIRPGFITDEGAYRARIGRMMAMADIVKLSDEDLNWLLGKGDTGALAREVLAMGPKVVCITQGADGARGVTARHDVRVEAARVAVADTVGAGDTFNAGILAALAGARLLSKAALVDLPSEAIRDALTLGCRAAAVTVGRPGADPPWAHEL
jgi:fructokinase